MSDELFDSYEQAAEDVDWRLPAAVPAPAPDRELTEREALDAEMRAVLAQIEICSHVPAAGWGPTGRSRSSDDPPGGQRPPGDTGHTKFAQAYGPPFHEATADHPGARSDEDRRRVIARARSELKEIRGLGDKPVVAGETRDQWERRLLREGEGFSAKEVAIRFRCGVRDVWKVREAPRCALCGCSQVAGHSGTCRARRHDVEERWVSREREFGREPGADLSTKERRRRVRDLAEKGHTIAQIARLVGAHRTTVERDLGRRRAA